MRSIGTAVASAVVGVILAQLTTGFGALTVPSRAGFQVVLALGAAAALTALAIAAFLPRHGGRDAAAAAPVPPLTPARAEA
jgi:hypothetical protein